MNSREIKSHLHNKMIDWFTNIENKELVEELYDSLFVTGGCIVSLIEDTKVNDYDVYLRSREVLVKLVRYYIKNIPLAEVSRTETGLEIIYPDTLYRYKGLCISPYQLKVFTKNAITLDRKIQVTIRFCGTPQEIHRNFDFLHCTHYWIMGGNYLKLNKKALVSQRNKKLVYVGSKYPISSIIRVRKFIGRGWEIEEEEENKIRRQIEELNLKDSKTYKDQTEGFYSRTHKQVARDIRNNGIKNFII